MTVFKVCSSVIVVLLLSILVLTSCGNPAPAAPTGVTATRGNGQVTLAWTAVSGATSYNIYLSTTTAVTPTSGSLIANATSPFIQTGLTNGITYYYVIKAVNANGESTASTQVSCTPAPPAPTDVSTTPKNGGVTIAWTSVPGATSYNIYWSTATGVAPGNGTRIPGVPTTFYTHTPLNNGTTYYYVVTAVFTTGESAPSTQVSARPSATPAPAEPIGVTATLGNGLATISWTAVPGATSYNIYWSTAPGVAPGNGTQIAGVTTASYTLAPLNNGTTYYYVVTAVFAGVESAASTQVSAIPSANPAPAEPIGVTATPGNGQVTISWTSVPGATSYNIYWSTVSGVTPANGIRIAGVTTPYTQVGLSNGTTYYYVVTAVNGNGESTASTQVSVAPST
jgi:fibronectin type 3 domain-containing protein